MSDLTTKLVEISPRENSGSISADGFDYQKNWALCKMMEIFHKRSDFVVAFDYHDDVLILDTEVEPQKIDFYQVKKRKSGNWSIKNLTKREKGSSGKAKNSIFGKLILHIVDFDTKVSSLNFVSNIPYNIELKDNSISRIKKIVCLNETSSKVLEQFKLAASAECYVKDDVNLEDFTFFIVSQLGADDHENSTIGKLNIFLESISRGKYEVPLIYRSLSDEIRRKNNYQVTDKVSYDELLKTKCISRKDFAVKINYYIAESKREVNKWQTIEQLLISENINVIDLKSLRSGYNLYEIDSMNGKNSILEDLVNKLISVYQRLKISGSLYTKTSIGMDLIYKEYISDPIKSTYFNQNYIKAVILELLVHYEDKEEN